MFRGVCIGIRYKSRYEYILYFYDIGRGYCELSARIALDIDHQTTVSTYCFNSLINEREMAPTRGAHESY